MGESCILVLQSLYGIQMHPADWVALFVCETCHRHRRARLARPDQIAVEPELVGDQARE